MKIQKIAMEYITCQVSVVNCKLKSVNEECHHLGLAISIHNGGGVETSSQV